MTDSVENFDELPPGWIGGDVVHTGGNLSARMWLNPNSGLRVGYSLDFPESVGLERVSFQGEEGQEDNPLMWRHETDITSRPCETGDRCQDVAFELMREFPTDAESSN